MYVDVLWILISDAGSTPATSTRLRFEHVRKTKPASAKFDLSDEAVLQQNKSSKLRPGEPEKWKEINFIMFIFWKVRTSQESIIRDLLPTSIKELQNITTERFLTQQNTNPGK